MILLNGQTLSQQIKNQLKTSLSLYPSKRRPGLAFVLVGNHPASQTYVKMKSRACEEVGIDSYVESLDTSISIDFLIQKIEALNQDPRIDGMIVQMPLPDHLPMEKVICSINPAKDVDGFHPLNLGKLLIQDRSGFIPCTPLGITQLLKAYSISCEGKHAVILGRSLIVGKPLANLLSLKQPGLNATVTLCHQKTPDLRTMTQMADILICAIGSPHFIDASYIKSGAVVIDVGINKKTINGSSELVGDVHFDSVALKAAALTPVPKGVGPMTIAMLLHNTVKSFLLRENYDLEKNDLFL